MILRIILNSWIFQLTPGPSSTDIWPLTTSSRPSQNFQRETGGSLSQRTKKQLPQEESSASKLRFSWMTNRTVFMILSRVSLISRKSQMAWPLTFLSLRATRSSVQTGTSLPLSCTVRSKPDFLQLLSISKKKDRMSPFILLLILTKLGWTPSTISRF